MTACEAPRCEGSGWVTLAPSTIERMSQRPAELDDGSLTGADPVRAEVLHRSAVRVAEKTVYPCKECNADAFFLWRGEHLRGDHPTTSCEVCQAAGIGGSKRRTSSGEWRTIKRGTPEGDAAMRGEQLGVF